MPRSLHTFTCWLAVAAMALVATVFQSGLVICTTADGAVHLEWGCGGVAGGGCTAPGPAEGPGAQTADCTDSPLKSEAPRSQDSRRAAQPAFLAHELSPSLLSLRPARPRLFVGDPSAHLQAARAVLRTTILVV